MSTRTSDSGFRRRGAIAATAIASCAMIALPTIAANASPAAPVTTQADLPAAVDSLIIGYDAAAPAASADELVETTSVDVEVADVAEVATDSEVVTVDAALTNGELDALIAEISSQPGVAYVEPDYVMTAQTNDASYGSLWGIQGGTTGIDAPAAWGETTGAGAVVAVLDTGITSHPDLDANVLPGYDFISNTTTSRDGDGRDANAQDEGDWYGAYECGPTAPDPSDSSWHGTHVAGTIAAVGNNGEGVVGVAYGAKVQPVRVLGKCGGSTSDIADAIVWASGGSVSGVPANSTPADVINLSLGGQQACPATTQRAVDTAVANGTTVVVAAGNLATNAANFSPASCNNVVTVAATDIGGNLAYYSNYGSVVDVSAPGGELFQDASGTIVETEGIYSTLNAGLTTPGAGSYAYYQGTSMATPHVAGVAALLAASEPGLTPAQIEQRLKSTVDALPGSCSGGCGTGLVDAGKALAAG